MSKTNHQKISLLLVLFLVMPLVIGIAYADMGPKPSITINVTNAPADYYIGLLQDDDVGGNFLEGVKNKEEVKNNAALETLVNYEHDGWKLHVSPVGDAYYHSTSPGTYEFGYSVPNRFRVILVTTSGTVYLSDPITKNRYNAVFDYKASSGEIKEVYSQSILNYIKNFLICYVLTLIVEGIILSLFGLSTKKNRIHFLIINTVTQLILNVVLICTDRPGGLDFWFSYFCCELGILLVEAVYYAIMLRKKDGTKKPLRSILYALTANLASVAVGFFYYTFYLNSL